MTINYDKMNREFPKQKAALTRALKSKDYSKVVATTRKTIAEWDETGAWPDDWAHWQRALDDAWWDAKARYLRDEIDEMPDQVSMDYLRADIQAERVAAIRAQRLAAGLVDLTVTFDRLPEVDAYAAMRGIDRSAAVNELVNAGLSHA